MTESFFPPVKLVRRFLNEQILCVFEHLECRYLELSGECIQERRLTHRGRSLGFWTSVWTSDNDLSRCGKSGVSGEKWTELEAISLNASSPLVGRFDSGMMKGQRSRLRGHKNSSHF